MAIQSCDLTRIYFETNRLFLELKAGMPISILNTFLGVIIWGHNKSSDDTLGIGELAANVGLPYTTVSQHLRYLGAFQRVDVPGLGLVETSDYIHDRRQKIVKLTAEGQVLANSLEFALRGINQEG